MLPELQYDRPCMVPTCAVPDRAATLLKSNLAPFILIKTISIAYKQQHTQTLIGLSQQLVYFLQLFKAKSPKRSSKARPGLAVSF